MNANQLSFGEYFVSQPRQEGAEYLPLVIEPIESDQPELAEIQRQLAALVERSVFLRAESDIIRLPSSAFLHEERSLAEDKDQLAQQPLATAKFFANPASHNELAELGLDNGRARPLSATQLAQVRQTGQFTVPSVLFPDKEHVWRLSKLMASGNEVHRKVFLWGLCGAWVHLRLIPRTLVGHGICTVRDSIENIPVVVRNLFELLVGRPETCYWRSFASLLENRRMEFLLREFTPEIKKWMQERKYFKELQERREAAAPIPPSSAILTQVINGRTMQLDLRLFDRDIYFNVIQIAEGVVQRFNVAWQHQKHRVAEQVLARAHPEAEQGALEVQVAEECHQVYMKKLLVALQQSDALIDTGGHGIASLLWAKLQTALLVQQADRQVTSQVGDLRRSFEEEVKLLAPVRSLLGSWTTEQVDQRMCRHLRVSDASKLPAAHRRAKYDRAVALMRELCSQVDADETPALAEKLEQELYLMERDRDWFNGEEDAARQWIEENMRVPSRVFAISSPYWTPRVAQDPKTGDFFLKTGTAHQVTTDCWMWRWRLLSTRLLSTCKLIAANGVQRLSRGEFSWRALFGRQPFATVTLVDPKTGRTSGGRYKPTLLSRLGNLWTDVLRSRELFERQPDTGLLGKGVSRIFNIVWNYGIKLGLGGTLASLAVPALVGIATVCNVVMIPGSLVLGPLLVSLRWLWTVFVFDYDSPGSSYPVLPLLQIALKFGGGVVLQAVFALALILIIHPALAVLDIGACTGISSLGYTYDWLMYHLVVKRRARIPQADTFLARRVSGPGLSMGHYYRLDLIEILAVLQVRLERDQLALFEAAASAQVQAPKTIYQGIIQRALSGFGWFQAHSKAVEENTSFHMEVLQEQLRQRRGVLPDEKVGQAVRLSPEALQVALRTCQDHMTGFIREKVFHEILRDSEVLVGEYWASRDLPRDDWEGLTRQYLTEAFSEQFLQPLGEDDCSVSLKIEHSAQVINFTRMIKQDRPRDDLDVATVYHHASEQAAVTVDSVLQRLGQLVSAGQLNHSTTSLSGTFAARSFELDHNTYGIGPV